MALLEAPPTLLKLLHESLDEEKHDDDEEILSYVAFLAASLAEAHEYDASVWKEALSPYLGDACSSMIRKDPDALVEAFRMAVEKEFTEEDDAESYGEDEDAEEVCNLRFNLAYGGKILLHQTRLRLLRGRRYALGKRWLSSNLVQYMQHIC